MMDFALQMMNIVSKIMILMDMDRRAGHHGVQPVLT